MKASLGLALLAARGNGIAPPWQGDAGWLRAHESVLVELGLIVFACVIAWATLRILWRIVDR